MIQISAFDTEEARRFADRWLPAWTGNDPERLVAFYSEDAYYADPAIPRGVARRAPLLAYFRKLLAHDPNWVWTQRGSIPLADGFLNEWHASIPVGAGTVEVDGVFVTGVLLGAAICLLSRLLVSLAATQRGAPPNGRRRLPPSGRARRTRRRAGTRIRRSALDRVCAPAEGSPCRASSIRSNSRTA